MKIKVSNRENLFFEIDDEFFDELKKHSPNLSISDRGGKLGFYSVILHKGIILSRLIMGCPFDNGLDVDHRDRNYLNNKKSNLRWATQKQNRCNQGKKQGNYTSKAKGVCKEGKIWRITLKKNGKRIYQQSFDTELDAIKKANELMVEHHKEFAVLNTLS